MVKSIHKHATHKQDEILHDLTNFSEDIANKAKIKSIQQQKHSKRKIQVFGYLKFVRGKINHGGGIIRFQVPKSWSTLATYNPTADYELVDPKKVKMSPNRER